MIEGNIENKYQTRNPLKKLIVSNFLKHLFELINQEAFHSVLEVGCGEGHLISFLSHKISNIKFFGVDISDKMVKISSKINPSARIVKADAGSLPFPDNSFDAVLLCEVLEHLNNPKMGILEARRVAKKNLIFSVPNEPWWRILNLIRFHYLGNFGNTPGHIHHWNRKTFNDLISKYLRVEKITTPFPWLMIKAKKI